MSFKRITALALALTLGLTLTACSGKKDETTTAATTTTTEATTTTAASGETTASQEETTTAAATDETTTDETTAAATGDRTSIAGTVKWLDWDWNKSKDELLIAEFNKIYPNIKIELEIQAWVDGDMVTLMTNAAAAQNLPDVAGSWNTLTTYVSQGWIAPIDKYFDADPEKQFISPVLTDAYKFGGKLYALPNYLQFNWVVANLDLLDDLNEDPPAYDWTTDEFLRLARKGTTAEYSGVNYLGRFASDMTAVLDPNKQSGTFGYNFTTKKFDLVSGAFAKAVNLQKELRSVPGLIADDLKNQAKRDAGEMDDYEKKFGQGADAVTNGKILFVVGGTWDWSWVKNLAYKYDTYPMPSDPEVGYREAVHADYVYMTSTAKDKDAAYELLRYLSISKEGQIFNINNTANAVDADGNSVKDYFMAPSSNPEVLDLVKASPYCPEGIKYMFDHVNDGFKADPYKTVPDFGKVADEQIWPVVEKVFKGEADAAAVAAEVEKNANDALVAAQQNFDTMIDKIQKEYDEANK